MSIDATLIGKWMPSTGHTRRTSDATQMCVACKTAPKAMRRGPTVPTSPLPRTRKRRNTAEAATYVADVSTNRTLANISFKSVVSAIFGDEREEHLFVRARAGA